MRPGWGRVEVGNRLEGGGAGEWSFDCRASSSALCGGMCVCVAYRVVVPVAEEGGRGGQQPHSALERHRGALCGCGDGGRHAAAA